MIRWAVAEQVEAGLDIVTDGEGRRENMYYFVQKRVDGVSFEEMEHRNYGPLGFGIEIPKVVGKLANMRLDLAHDWKVARAAAPAHVQVKLTCTGPHMMAKFSNNGRPDLYPTDRSLAEAYADLLRAELKEVVAAGCNLIQFDEPGWTAFPDEAVWGAQVLNRVTEGLGVQIGLHVCCGNAYRKRAYTTKYDDLAEAFRTVKLDQAVLEHCTLDYDMMSLWDKWNFAGDFAVGVIDQRKDEMESVEEIVRRTQPALKHFPPERILLTSECGFGHVPLPITRGKLRLLAAAAANLRSGLH